MRIYEPISFVKWASIPLKNLDFLTSSQKMEEQASTVMVEQRRANKLL